MRYEDLARCAELRTFLGQCVDWRALALLYYPLSLIASPILVM